MIVGGWRLAGITTFNGGVPLNMTVSIPTSMAGWQATRPDRVMSEPLYKGRNKNSHDIINGIQWFNPAAYAVPTAWTWGNAHRNDVWGPGGSEWDMSGSKTFGTPWDKMHVEFRADFFNAFNHVSLGAPNVALPDQRDGGAVNNNIGRITSDSSSPRLGQLSLTVKF
jgi:hypothetical protein